MTTNILEHYKILVHFLGETLGPDFEIVLQDLTTNNIVAIANNHVSGRSIGSPLTNAALQMLSSKIYEKNDFLCNYKGVAENGHILRSSTMFIKDESGTPVGLLCINFDDSRYMELYQKLQSVIHPADFNSDNINFNKKTSAPPDDTTDQYSSITEAFPMDMSSLMQKIFEDSATGFTTPADHLNQQERKEVMVKLNEQGLFQLKGAIPFVAKKFSCSTATVYRYLSEITS